MFRCSITLCLPCSGGLPWQGPPAGDRTVARCSCGVAQPAQPHRGQHLGLLPPPVRGAGTLQGAVPGGLQQCQKIPAATPPSLPLPWVTLLCSSPSAPGRSHPLQPLPSPSSRASHNRVSIYSGQVGDLLSSLFHFHFELDYCLPHKSSPEYLRSI